MIQKIFIKNFSVFENIEIDFNNGVNVFIGENGTGKTHLLKLLYAAHLTRLENPPSLNSVFGEDFDIAVTVSNLITDEVLISKGMPNETKINSIVKTFVRLEDGRMERAYVQLEDGSIMEAYGQIVGNCNSNVTIVSHTPYIPVFIPAKDMLTHGRLEKDYAERDLPFDRTLIEILNKAGVSTVRNIHNEMLPIANSIIKIIGGTIEYNNDRYYVRKANGDLVGFDMEAEGYKRLGLIYRLIATGYFKKGSVLIWDEPEANLNPNRIPDVVGILLALANQGVQIFLATHHYELTKYLDIRSKGSDLILFHSLYKTEEGIKCESNNDFEKLNINAINTAVDILMDEMLGRN